MTTFEEDFEYQTNFYSQVQDILAQNAMHFVSVKVADGSKDMKQATDFVVVSDKGDIALRIRRKEYHYRDLTIRSYKRGHKTELQKILEGWARHYLYCWEGEDGDFSDWILVDLNKVRSERLLINREETQNTDGYTRFIAIPVSELEEHDCLVAKKKIEPSGIHWPIFPVDDHPIWPRETYVKWLTRGRGTKEQQARYQEAIAWYDKH